MKKIKSKKGSKVIVSPFDQDDSNQDKNDSESQIQKMNYPASIIINNGKYKIHCLTIVGEIEGHNYSSENVKTTKYEYVIPQLVAIEQEPSIDGLLVLINTIGGDIEAGLALAEIISGMKKPTVSLVIGGGHSIGVPLAVAAKKSFIAKSASMIIHPVRMNGINLGVPQTFRYFQRIQNRITSFISENSNIKPNKLVQLMSNTEEFSTDIGSTLDGSQAVKEGIIDSLGNISDAITCLHNMVDKTYKKKSKRKTSKK
ncbi:MAG: ATP-dependent Clp protease proteolytic subunit [Oscillospiraceae bacterium]|nr:ATP-dependent Clp protease proteolytic subunit [Oscillospiraceae bacterium]